MGLNNTPSSDRIHIGFFGKRNAGKSSLVNAITGQDLAVVSEIKGTTTDPVYKSMELLPLGPVMIIDTPGYDDAGKLGEMRVKKTRQVLNKTDIAIIVVDSSVGITDSENEILKLIEKKNIPHLIVYNKSDLSNSNIPDNVISVSAETGVGINQLKDRIGALISDEISPPIVKDLVKPSDLVVLVIPIDKAAPKGRLILPQQQTIRELLDAGAASICVQDNKLSETLASIGRKPSLVITDSQAFEYVASITPHDMLLTSFSILMARHKGYLETAVNGIAALDNLKDGDTILISEGCTHHRQCDDIGSVKLPRWIKNHTKKELKIEFSSGGGFPEDLTKYSLIVHCGGCMLNEREVKYRINCAAEQNVPFTNYGIIIAYIHGILKRSLEIFPNLYKQIKK